MLCKKMGYNNLSRRWEPLSLIKEEGAKPVPNGVPKIRDHHCAFRLIYIDETFSDKDQGSSRVPTWAVDFCLKPFRGNF
jgi:hypothetical protein